MTVHAPKHAFTVEEYHRMAEAGIFTEDDRVELIEGEVLEMAAIGTRHASTVDRLNKLFVQGAGDRAIVRIQNPVQLGDRSEPEPDVAVVEARADFYGELHPSADDILLLVEVSDSSHRYDVQLKVPVYAMHGVRELWRVDLETSMVTVYRDPSSEGYRSVSTARSGETLSPAALPGLRVAVAAILGG